MPCGCLNILFTGFTNSVIFKMVFQGSTDVPAWRSNSSASLNFSLP